MRSITLSQLRTPKLWLPWLKAGETIELCERKRVIAHIVPVIPWPHLDKEDESKKEGKE